jgi:hypothetical protein
MKAFVSVGWKRVELIESLRGHHYANDEALQNAVRQ